MRKSYFDWLCDMVDAGPSVNYRDRHRLLFFLYKKPFVTDMLMDENRIGDAMRLREEFGVSPFLSPNCLEIMIALARRMETEIMCSPVAGDRTAKWFCGMLESLEMYDMDDKHFDPEAADVFCDRWLGRYYEPNGHGGLFTMRCNRKDARLMELWEQANQYLNEFLDI